MKKYLFGMFAVALAVAFSAFTAPSKKTNLVDPIKFEYLGDDESGFQDPDNWRVVTTFGIECPQLVEAEIACRVEVSLTDPIVVDTKEELAAFLSNENIDTETELDNEPGIDVLVKKDEQ